MDLRSIYTELLMEHSRNSANKKELPGATDSKPGSNPSCGDEITLYIKRNGDVIEDASFTGAGCAISQASTSMMIDLMKGKTVQEAKDLIHSFLRMIQREDLTEEEIDALGDAYALENISNMPQRVKCAVLAWRTLDDLLKE